ncbi:MAG: DUF4175 family protein [Myxococcota bacterium]
MQEHQAIKGILGRLGDNLQRAQRLDSTVWVATGGLNTVSLALLLAHGGAPRAGAAALILGAFVLVVLWGLLWWRAARHLREAYSFVTASLAEQLMPSLGTSPSSAVDFVRRMERSTKDFSYDLARAHLQRTAGQLDEAALKQRLQLHRRKPRQIALTGLVLSGLLAVGLSIGLKDARRRLGTLLLDPSAAQLSETPLAADIEIIYRYPAYTNLPERVIQGGDGSISAVVGTEVELRAIADRPTRDGALQMTDLDGKALQDVPLKVDEDKRLMAVFSVLRDGRYQFALTDAAGDRFVDAQKHGIRAILDEHPQVYLDEPKTDIEIKDDQAIEVLWRARDDFGVGNVNLVIEPDGGEALKLPMFKATQPDKRREGRYRWSIAELTLQAGAGARFYVEAFDNDTISGSKRGVSSSHRLVLFSAQRHHETLLAKQREALGKLVDWLADELVSPFPQTVTVFGRDSLVAAHRVLIGGIGDVAENLQGLLTELRQDTLSGPEIALAFQNVLEHVSEAKLQRTHLLGRVVQGDFSASRLTSYAREQSANIRQLEKDIIYLDDLMALQQIDELKETARDLLAAQRNLQDLLSEYKQTQDSQLRAQLEQSIRQMRQRMMDLLARMSQIKQQLPGEYRNLESSSMLELGDQIDRLEKLLQDGDLDAAAKEIEQMANMLENMMGSIDEAEEEFGGERYAEMRRDLAEFGQEFKALEEQQQVITKRGEEMLRNYREKSIANAGKSLEAFVDKARQRVQLALEHLDKVAEVPNLYGVSQHLDKARQRLLDLDALLEHQDFSEARQMAAESLDAQQELKGYLGDRVGRHSRAPAWQDAEKAAASAVERTDEVRKMLDELFPDPEKVLSPQEMEQMRRMSQRQQELQQRAEKLGEKMGAMAQEMPLFGGQPRSLLDAAKREMGDAAESLGSKQLPGAVGHERRALEMLGELRQGLEQAAQKSGGQGMPLPLGGPGQGRGPGRNQKQENVEIPPQDPNRDAPRFRQDLLEAAKQPAPERYEDAVQRYYKELIR